MYRKYLVAKAVAIFFSIATVVLFLLSRNQMVYEVIPVDVMLIILLVNFGLLVASLVVFIWMRSRKDLDLHEESKILNAYALHEKQDADDKNKK